MQGVHLVLMYRTSRQAKDQYAGKYLVAVGEQQDNGQCMFVKTSDPHWVWVEVDVLANYSNIGKFYKNKGNRLETYDIDGGATGGKRMIPRLAMVPAHVGRRVIKKELTAWEIVILLRSMNKSASTELKDLFNPALTWALQASWKNNRGGRRMELTMSPMMKVHPAAKLQMQRRVNSNLGDWKASAAPAAAPVPGQALTQTTDTVALAQLTVAAMQRQEETEHPRQTKLREELEDAFLKGMDIKARRHSEINRDPTYKRFSRT